MRYPVTSFSCFYPIHTCDFVKQLCSSNISAMGNQWKLKFQVKFGAAVYLLMDQKKCCHACRQHSLQYILSMFTWSQSILFNISCCYFGVICWCPLLVSKGISQNIGGIKISWLSFISIFSSKITVLRGQIRCSDILKHWNQSFAG